LKGVWDGGAVTQISKRIGRTGLKWKQLVYVFRAVRNWRENNKPQGECPSYDGRRGRKEVNV
jgi:hypothetical protein